MPSVKRLELIELIELLCQGKKTVEGFAAQAADIGIKLASVPLDCPAWCASREQAQCRQTRAPAAMALLGPETRPPRNGQRRESAAWLTAAAVLPVLSSNALRSANEPY